MRFALLLWLLVAGLLTHGQGQQLATAKASHYMDHDYRRSLLISANLSSGGQSGEEPSDVDKRGAEQVQPVFRHRFQHVLGNESLRVSFIEALSVIYGSPEELSRVFSQLPASSAQLDRSPSTVETIKLARQLAEASRNVASATARPRVVALLRQLAEQVDKLPVVFTCQPVVRRIALAAIVELQLRLHAAVDEASQQSNVLALRSDPDVRLLTFQICRSLYNKHRQGAAYKGVVEFLHVSKSGGTSMCTVADRNGCKAESTTNFGNCMVRRFDDRPRWVSAEAHMQTLPIEGWRWFYRYAVRRGNRTCEYR